MQKNIFKSSHLFILSSTILILILLSGCENEKTQIPIIPVENTTEVFTSKDKKTQSEKIQIKKIEKEKIAQVQVPHEEVTNKELEEPRTYTLKEKDKTYKITLLNKTITFQSINSPVVMINLFTPQSTVSTAHINSLQTLVKKHPASLFVLNLVKDAQNEELNNFSNTLHSILNIKESSSLGLSIIYKHGKYYSHFEGDTPIEMITHNIKQAIKR